MGAKVSNSDSFIDEVTDEVKRDKLFAQMRRYGPIAVLLVLALVGGAAWTEYRNARDAAAAAATGDAIYAAISEADATARAAALSALPVDGDAGAIAALLAAAAQNEAGDTGAAVAALNAVANNTQYPQAYRDLAAFKAAMVPSDDVAARIAVLEDLARPGQPYAPLAREQIAYAQLESGDTVAALATMREIAEDAATSQGLRDRMQTLMLSLGEPMPQPVTQ